MIDFDPAAPGPTRPRRERSWMKLVRAALPLVAVLLGAATAHAEKTEPIDVGDIDCSALPGDGNCSGAPDCG